MIKVATVGALYWLVAILEVSFVLIGSGTWATVIERMFGLCFGALYIVLQIYVVDYYVDERIPVEYSTSESLCFLSRFRKAD